MLESDGPISVSGVAPVRPAAIRWPSLGSRRGLLAAQSLI